MLVSTYSPLQLYSTQPRLPTRSSPSLLLGHLFDLSPMKEENDDCQKGIHSYKRKPLIQVYASKVVAEVQEWYCHNPVHQETVHVALHTKPCLLVCRGMYGCVPSFQQCQG